MAAARMGALCEELGSDICAKSWGEVKGMCKQTKESCNAPLAVALTAAALSHGLRSASCNETLMLISELIISTQLAQFVDGITYGLPACELSVKVSCNGYATIALNDKAHAILLKLEDVSTAVCCCLMFCRPGQSEGFLQVLQGGLGACEPLPLPPPQCQQHRLCVPQQKRLFCGRCVCYVSVG